MSSAPVMNNRPRKSLASQLDRLDEILDALSDGLNGAVRDTVEQVVERVVREAVQAAVTAVLADADVRRLLAPASPRRTVVGTMKQAWRALAGTMKNCWARTRDVARAACCTVAAAALAASVASRGHVAATTKRLKTATVNAWLWTLLVSRLAVRLRKPLLFAVSAGFAVGSGSYLSGAMVAAVVSGLACTLLTLTGLALRRIYVLMGHLQPTL